MKNALAVSRRPRLDGAAWDEPAEQAAPKSGAVIWASSRDIGEPWLNRDGSKQSWQHSGGHFACIWRHEGGLFYIKDPSGHVIRHNDVPYTHDQMEAWLVGAFENRYVIRAAGESRP